GAPPRRSPDSAGGIVDPRLSGRASRSRRRGESVDPGRASRSRRRGESVILAEPRRAAYLTPGRDLSAAVELARRAEALDYESVWLTHGLGRDSFLVLAAYGAATTRVGLGVGVVPIYPRHPVAMAQAALTLSEITGGRFTLGIGVSHRATMEAMLGLALDAPLAVMREYVAVLRGALGAGADFEGRHFRVRWSLALPERPAAPRIYLAALSRKMLELAGEIADGAILWLCPPAYPARSRCRRSSAGGSARAKHSRASRSSPRCRSRSPAMWQARARRSVRSWRAISRSPSTVRCSWGAASVKVCGPSTAMARSPRRSPAGSARSVTPPPGARTSPRTVAPVSRSLRSARS